MSAYEYFGQRFGYGARAYSGLAFSAGHFSKMGFVLYLLSLTASSMTGWNIYLVLLITGGGDGALHRVRRAGGGDLDRRGARLHHVCRAWS